MKLYTYLFLLFSFVFTTQLFAEKEKEIEELLDRLQHHQELINPTDKAQVKPTFLSLVKDANEIPHNKQVIRLIIRMFIEQASIILNHNDKELSNAIKSFLKNHDEIGQIRKIIELTINLFTIKYILFKNTALKQDRINKITENAKEIIIYHNQNESDNVYNINYIYKNLREKLLQIYPLYPEIKDLLFLYEILPERNN